MCVFTPVMLREVVTMDRNIDLTHYLPIIEARRARAVVLCYLGADTKIDITELAVNETKLEADNTTSRRWFALLQRNTVRLQIRVRFIQPQNVVLSWLNYIHLYVYSDIRAPDTELMHTNWL
jgi:hypothetical protein